MTTDYGTIFGTPDHACVIMSGSAFDSLSEYSASLPTGTTAGKQWRCRRPAFGEPHEWWIGEYGPVVDGHVPIAWRRLFTRWEAEVYLDSIRDGITLGKGYEASR